MQKTTNKIIKIILPLFIIGLGLLGALLLIERQTPPQKVKKEVVGAVVEVEKIKEASPGITLKTTGTVHSRRIVNLTMRVSGRVTKISPKAVVGGFFQKGEEIFRINREDYQIALTQAEAELARTRLELARIRNQAEVARREWEKIHPDQEADPLVVYKPQLKNAQAQVRAAEAAVQQARLNLKRTVIRSPFDSLLSSKKFDIGQYLQRGAAVAEVSSTDIAEVKVFLLPDQMKWLTIPEAGSGKKGSPATVTYAGNSDNFNWQGAVVRSVGKLDAATRMMGLIIAVEDPYNLSEKSGRPPIPMADNMFIKAAIKGKLSQPCFEIPRSGLRDNSIVWLVGKENSLVIKEVEVIRKNKENVLISSGITAGDRLIISPVSGAAEGLKLRIKSGESSQ